MPRYTPQVAKLKARRLIKLHNDNGFNQSRVAEIEGVTPSAINHRLSKLPVKKTMSELLDKAGVTDDRLSKKIDEGLEAIKIDSFTKVPDHNARHKYITTALEVKGHVKHNGKDINIQADRLIFQDIKIEGPIEDVVADFNSRFAAQFRK